MAVVPELLELRSILKSWPKVEALVKLDPGHRRRITNKPGYGARVSPITCERVTDALHEHRPFPLSYLGKGREVLTKRKAKPGDEELENYLIVLDDFLNEHDPADQRRLLEYKYMRMMVCMSKALHHGLFRSQNWFGGPKEWPEHLRVAQATAEEGIKIADVILAQDPKDERIAHLRGILFINWIQIIQEQVKAKYKGRSGRRMTVAEKEKLFRDQEALPKLKALLRKFPYLWQAAYNGLEQGSSLREKSLRELRLTLWFYAKLKRLDRGFQDFDYSPGEVLAISKEPGMAWFNETYRAKHHVTNPVPQMTIRSLVIATALLLGSVALWLGSVAPVLAAILRFGGTSV